MQNYLAINKANWEEAKIEAMKTKILDMNGKRYPICGTPISKLRNYGLGIWLYMLFLKSLCVISVIICILITPSVICNMSMSGISAQQESSVFDRFTLANQNNNQYQAGATTWWPSFNKVLIDNNLNGDILLYTDLIYSFTFGIAIVIMTIRMDNLIDSAEYELTFMNDYSIEVKGIPKSGFSDEELKSFLEKYGGKIVEIYYARYYKGMLSDYIKIAEIYKQIRTLEVKLSIKAEKIGCEAEQLKNESK